MGGVLCLILAFADVAGRAICLASLPSEANEVLRTSTRCYATFFLLNQDRSQNQALQSTKTAITRTRRRLSAS